MSSKGTPGPRGPVECGGKICVHCNACPQWDELHELCTIQENFDYDYVPSEIADYPCGIVILDDERAQMRASQMKAANKKIRFSLLDDPMNKPYIK